MWTLADVASFGALTRHPTRAEVTVLPMTTAVIGLMRFGMGIGLVLLARALRSHESGPHLVR